MRLRQYLVFSPRHNHPHLTSTRSLLDFAFPHTQSNRTDTGPSLPKWSNPTGSRSCCWMWSAEPFSQFLWRQTTAFSCLTTSTRKTSNRQISSLIRRWFANYPMPWSFNKHRRIELVSVWVNERASGWVGVCVRSSVRVLTGTWVIGRVSEFRDHLIKPLKALYESRNRLMNNRTNESVDFTL